MAPEKMVAEQRVMIVSQDSSWELKEQLVYSASSFTEFPISQHGNALQWKGWGLLDQEDKLHNAPPVGIADQFKILEAQLAMKSESLAADFRHCLGGHVFKSISCLCETQRGAITDLETGAKEFVGMYYLVCDCNPSQLLNVYQEGSMSTFVGEKIQGSQNIVTKLKSDLRSYRHVISNVECQPSGPAGGVFAMVKGELQRTDGPDAFKFSQIFHLIPTPQGSFYVLNDIFRLI